MPLQRLLVPIDFSEMTDHLVQVAIDIAQPFEATVTLIHAYMVPPVPYGGPFAPVMDELGAAAREPLEALLERTKARYARCDCILRGGTIHAEILDTARECHADWIVIGSHGRGAVARVLLGSIAERVVRLAPIPVLVVPPRGT